MYIDLGSIVLEEAPEDEEEEELDDDNDDEDDWDEDDYADGHEDGPASQDRDRNNKNKVPFNRVLPVAELPDDFDGEVLDGATFLALSKLVGLGYLG